jgi:hypothetical protein
MSQRPLIISLQVKTQILLTTVAGRSSMDRIGAALVKAYEWHHDVLYGPYIKAGRMKQRPR